MGRIEGGRWVGCGWRVGCASPQGGGKVGGWCPEAGSKTRRASGNGRAPCGRGEEKTGPGKAPPHEEEGIGHSGAHLHRCAVRGVVGGADRGCRCAATPGYEPVRLRRGDGECASARGIVVTRMGREGRRGLERPRPRGEGGIRDSWGGLREVGGLGVVGGWDARRPRGAGRLGAGVQRRARRLAAPLATVVRPAGGERTGPGKAPPQRRGRKWQSAEVAEWRGGEGWYGRESPARRAAQRAVLPARDSQESRASRSCGDAERGYSTLREAT